MKMSIMKKLFFFLSIITIIVSSPFAAIAGVVTPERVTNMVEGWLTLNSQPFGGSAKSYSRLEMRSENGTVDSSGVASYYVVFLEPSGVIIVPTCDELEPITVYLPKATDLPFNPDDPFHRSILQPLAKQSRLSAQSGRGASDNQSKWAFLENNHSSRGKTETISDVRVAPLTATKWNQGDVYYFDGADLLTKPLYNYYTPNNYVTGCVPAAFGQLMKYHNHPKQGIGVHSFSYTVDGVKKTGQTRGGDGAGGAYKWNDMPNEPDENTIEEQARNISALLADVGLSIGVEYTSYESGGSARAAVEKLLTTFQYSNAIDASVFVNQGGTWVGQKIPLENLVAMVNPNLDAGFPCALSMPNHALVVDGYGYDHGTMYHHLNMGWGGYEDLWYSFSEDVYITGCYYNIFPTKRGEIVSGRVLDTNGLPIAGATVSIAGPDQQSTTTDANGSYAFKYLNSNKAFNLIAIKDDYSIGSVRVKTGVSTSKSHICGNQWNVTIIEGVDDIDVDSGSGGGGGCNAGFASMLILASLSCAAIFSKPRR